MKVNPLFVLREIADEYVVIPVGDEASRVSGIISLNEQGAFLWKLLDSDQTEETLVDALTEEFDVEADVARKDIQTFLSQLKEIGCLI